MIMGPRDQDPKHLSLFFLESDDTLKDSGWDAVLIWGHLKSFFAQKRRVPRDEFSDLWQDLGRIFNRLQCLPVAGVPKGCYKGSIWIEGEKGFQIWANSNHYCLKKTLVVKGSSRSRKKKGFKSIPQQAKAFADIRGSEKEVPLGSKAKTSTWTLIILTVMMTIIIPMKTLSRRLEKVQAVRLIVQVPASVGFQEIC